MNELVLNEARELIAGFIANRRKELGISQAELAERTQLGIATIKRMEGAKFWPNMKQLMIICQSLDLYFFVEEKVIPHGRNKRATFGSPKGDTYKSRQAR